MPTQVRLWKAVEQQQRWCILRTTHTSEESVRADIEPDLLESRKQMAEPIR
jgi:hypothetical protein